MKQLIPFLALLFAACAPAATPTPTPRVITIHASPAAKPWLSEAFTCADTLQIALSVADNPAAADLSLRLGEADRQSAPAFQIGQDDLLVLVPRESPLQNLDASGVRALFASPGPQTSAWVFDEAADVQQVFEKQIMQDTPVTNQARLALSPQQMSDTLNNEPGVVGFLPRRWKAGTIREIFTLPGVPVLAITPEESVGQVKELLSCLQSSSGTR